MPLTSARDTKSRSGNQVSYPVAANKTLWQGGIVATDAAGNLTPGAVATTLTAQGIAEETADNSAGAAGAIPGKVKKGVFGPFKNHGADLVTQADVKKDCFIVDDETVAKTNGGNTRSIAGKVVSVEEAGVWVRFD